MRGPSPSQFRIVALGIAILVTVSAAIATQALATNGGRTRTFGWTAVRTAQGFEASVAPEGPAAGLLRDGDVFVAVNGDRRVGRLTPLFLRQPIVARDYAVTVRRDGVETTIPLTLVESRSQEQQRLSGSVLLVGVVWCVVATLIALFRPDQPVARLAYAAGMGMGLFFLSNATNSTLPWMPHLQQLIIFAVFPISPMHLAIGYDFYLRFPTGIAAGRFWRGVRVILYALCGTLAVRSLAELAAFALGEQTYVAFRVWAAPLEAAAGFGSVAAQAIAGIAILAVLARNYRTVSGGDDRRRLRWVVWGTIVGLTPFLIVSQLRLILLWVPSIRPFVTTWIIPANIATIAIPLSFGYAIIRHHVFDITFIVRRGLQYLLARNALRALLLLPIAALAYGLAVHRAEPIATLLLTNSVYLYFIVAAIAGLRFRTQMSRWLDRRFFREAYDRERMLLRLIDDVETLESASSVSKLVSHELESAFHPRCLFVWYRDGDKPHLTLSYSSGGLIHSVELGPQSPLVQLAERESGVIEMRSDDGRGLPRDDREWIADTGIRLMVPMIGPDRRLVGLLMLGDKKSEEPYSADDLKLLQAIARQIAAARETVRLKDQVDRDRRLRHDVLAHLETGLVSLLKECPSCGACYDGGVAACAADGTELQLSLPVERTIEGKYRLDRLIGKGGMGAVYEAADLRLARQVAVKIMLGRAFGDREALRRFEREAQASARLAHPNIVTVFDFGVVGAAGAFLVMELVRGRTLRAELDRAGPIDPRTAAPWFEQICGAVAAAHHAGIVHRDLKPENVLVTSSAAGEDVVKVLDFGLAKMAALEGADSGGLTQPGMVMGTAGYMAPEQLMAGEVDHRSDIFALGVMAVEAVTGRRPFRGRTHDELLTVIMRDTLSLGGEGDAMRALEVVLRRAAAKDASARYGSVADLARDLVPALRALPPLAPVPGDGGAETKIA